MPRSQTVRQRMRKWFDDYKQACGCEWCESRVELEFHHIDPQAKVASISQMISERRSWKKVFEETEKCIILCKQCHIDAHKKGLRNA